MSQFIIQGKKPLQGEIGVLGSKNAAGPCLAACLLTTEECLVSNVPRIADVFTFLDIIKDMGAGVEWVKKRVVKIKAEHLEPSKIDLEKVAKARMSVLLIGALLARFPEFKIGRPGGDRIGLRPITTHLKALQALGVGVEETNGCYVFSAPVDVRHLRRVVLSEFSVTATENILLAAVLGKGKRVLKCAAVEPHVQDLVAMLKKMGADIEWAGCSHGFQIKGVEKLHSAGHKIVSDYLEAGTFIAMAAATEGEVIVKNMEPSHLELFLLKLKEMGVEFERGEDWVKVFSTSEFKPVRVQALPYPGFPTDLLPLVVPLLTQAKGKSLIHDPLYENRLNYVQELRKMKADIEIVDPHRAFVFGPSALRGVAIESWDIRAGASLVAAGLMAEGKTLLGNVEQIDRGYERLEERLQQLGADIKRIVP